MKPPRAVTLIFASAAVAACAGSHGVARPDSGAAGAAGSGGVAGTAGDTGGAPASGAAGVASAGHAGAAGSRPDAAPSDVAGDEGAPRVDGASAHAGGCGMPVTSPAPAGGYFQSQVMTTGATPAGPRPEKAAPRAYWVHLPSDYDPNRSYPTVFLTGECASGTARPATFPFYDPSQGGDAEAIYVLIDAGAPNMGLRCYDVSAGDQSADFEAFALIHDAIAARYCVDEDRVFVISLGPSVSNQLGCYFGGTPDPSRPFGRTLHVRGQALYDGWGEPAPQPPCHGPVAAIWFDNEQAPPPNKSSGDSLTRVLAQDGCTGAAMSPWMQSFPCQQALGCPAGYPVVLCAAVFGRTDQEALTVKMFGAFVTQASQAP